MRKLIVTFLALSAILTACNTENKTSSKADSSTAITTDTSMVRGDRGFTDGCYAYIANRDTATLALKVSGEEITGDLSYRWFEKDRNIGTIAGEIKGDTIIAEYDYNSEGNRSIREIVFLKKDGKLYEGFGEVEEKGTKTVFKNRTNLKFEGGVIFNQTDCK